MYHFSSFFDFLTLLAKVGKCYDLREKRFYHILSVLSVLTAGPDSTQIPYALLTTFAKKTQTDSGRAGSEGLTVILKGGLRTCPGRPVEPVDPPSTVLGPETAENPVFGPFLACFWPKTGGVFWDISGHLSCRIASLQVVSRPRKCSVFGQNVPETCPAACPENAKIGKGALGENRGSQNGRFDPKMCPE